MRVADARFAPLSVGHMLHCFSCGMRITVVIPLEVGGCKPRACWLATVAHT